MADKKNELKDIDLDNPEFRTIYSLLNNTRSSVFMTGKAGTGKSTFLKYITANIKKKFVVLAPTGIAAVNVGGVTMHSFFRIPLQPLMPDDVEFSEKRLRNRLKYPAELIKILRELELIIIDEISMVRADVLDFVDKVLRFYTKNRREPFGGKQLLLVGDAFQLEPVVTSDTREIMRRWYRSAYFFDALVFRDIELVPIELRKVYRQNDQQFISLLDRVRVGGMSPDDIRLVNSRYVRAADLPDDDSEMVMTLATRRDIVSAINDNRLARLPGREFSYTAQVHGEFPESAMPADKTLTLKVDSQVVFIRNDHDRRWVNGTIGRVYELGKDFIKVILEDGNKYDIELEQWDNIRYSYDEVEHKVVETVIGSFIQYPLRLAWALTIHKSQGLTFNNVRIDMGSGAFSSGQTYVALSRCRSLEGLQMLTPLFAKDVIVNSAVVNFARHFNDGQLIQAAIDNALADDAIRDGLRALDGHDINGALEAMAEIVRLRPAALLRPAVRRYIRRRLSFVNSREREITALRERIEHDRQRFDDLAEEYVALGNICLESAADYEPALANYDKALSLSPDNINALLGKARTLAKTGDYDRSADTYALILEHYPDNYNAAIELADICIALDRLHDAMNYLMVSVDKAPDRPEPLERLADIYESIGEIDMADELRDRARKLRRPGRRPSGGRKRK